MAQPSLNVERFQQFENTLILTFSRRTGRRDQSRFVNRRI